MARSQRASDGLYLVLERQWEMEMIWPDMFLKDCSDICLITNEKTIFSLLSYL